MRLEDWKALHMVPSYTNFENVFIVHFKEL